MKSNLVDIIVELKHQTMAAVLVDDGDREVWLPLSQIEIEDNGNGTHTVTCPEWLAMEKELI